MKVLIIETTPAGKKGSMPVYARMLRDALGAVSNGNDEVIVSSVNLAPPRAVMRYIPSKLYGQLQHIWMLLTGPLRLLSRKVDIFHIADGSFGYLAFFLPPDKTVVTVHDMIPTLQRMGRFPVDSPGCFARYVILGSIRGVKRSGKIVSVSQNTARDLIQIVRVVHDKISVVHSAIPGYTQGHMQQKDQDNEDHERGRFLLHVGNNGFYKNRIQVLKVFETLIRMVRFRICLKMVGPQPNDLMLSFIKAHELSHVVDFVVEPPDEVVVELYQTASLLLFPSIYEGFGWPPLEAMSHGCPVVCSDGGSLAEIVGNAALVCRPEDTKGMAECCLEILENKELCRIMRERGRAHVRKFTLETMGLKIRQVYHEGYC